MRSYIQLALLVPALLGSVPGVAARPKGCQAGKAGGKANGVAKAVYFMTNDAQNAVVAVPIGADGLLSGGVLTATGGAGSNSIDGSNNKPAIPDALVSQSALTVAGNNIFAVNAGSNTLSMLAINPNDPTKLVMVGQPIAVPGEFPNTVGASNKNKLVCVGTSGAVAGISCASFSNNGLGQMDALRKIDLGQTTPPVGPTNTVSQVFFSADESTVFTTVKGDPAANKTGFISALAVEQDCNQPAGAKGKAVMRAAAQDVRTSPNGTVVLFGSQPIPGTSKVFATDAAFGAAILDINDNDEATLVAKQEIADQKATCWVTVSAATKTAFVTDVANNRVVEMSLDDAKIIGQTDLSANGDPGLIDLKAAGNFVYALSPGNGVVQAAVTVLDVSGGPGTAKQVQHFELGALGAGANSMGMAVLV